MTPALADAFGGPIYGVEPSDGMRAEAEGNASHPAITYLAGSAEQIPLPDDCCDAALLFFVWHHVNDREAAVGELRRVVKPGGTVFVQANLSDRMPDTWWFRVVPEWKQVDTTQFQTAEETGVFAAAGWTPVAHDQVVWQRSASLADDLAKLKLRPVSAFRN